MIEAWADRTAELSASCPASQQVFCFENRGQEIGVTLHHPHGQIYAYPFVTPRTEAAAAPGRGAPPGAPAAATCCADVLAAERRAGTRVVLRGEHWTAYVPAAARWPVEVHLAPHRDVPDLAALDEAERDELATSTSSCCAGPTATSTASPRCRTSPAGTRPRSGTGRELGRLHLQLFSVLRAAGKLKYLAGSESGDGRLGERRPPGADRCPPA